MKPISRIRRVWVRLLKILFTPVFLPEVSFLRLGNKTRRPVFSKTLCSINLQGGESLGVKDEALDLLESQSLPLIGWERGKSRVLMLEEQGDLEWFFLGDIHGDESALRGALDFVRQHTNFRLCFLGDLIDRGPESGACFTLFMEFVFQHPWQILWLMGNHDGGIFLDESASRRSCFDSRVTPSEFAGWLNESPRARGRLGRTFIHVAQGVPRAALFNDGLLATHGGVPLEDLWPSLKSLESFEQPRVLEDFTWVRLCDQPSKKGWKYEPEKRRHSSNFQMGFRDLEGFTDAVKTWFPVRRIVRGHDHIREGFKLQSGSGKIPVLTLTGFSGFNSVPQRDTIPMGLAQKEQVPKLIQIKKVSQKHLLADPKKPVV